MEQFGDFGMELSFAITTSQQSLIRRRAYTMIRDAFAANGIEFAHPTVHVGSEEKPAAAAAATANALARKQAAEVWKKDRPEMAAFRKLQASLDQRPKGSSGSG
ncbi:MAG: mechanosensitive ion channel family protein [Mesorhizobium sp.]|nr:MAG: mechanosensitive ion channel family protein [Mesorhizobium sp.]